MKPQSLLLVLGAVVVVAGAAGVALIVGNPFSAKLGVHALRPGNVNVLALGGKVYQAQCAACHGVKLEGQANWRDRDRNGLLPAPPHDATGHSWHHPDEVLFRVTKFGVAKGVDLKDYASAMPAYEGVLSDAEIVAALSWIKSQWPAQIREQHDQMNAQYRKAQPRY